jgi:mono/diheme cytochrome c family protein
MRDRIVSVGFPCFAARALVLALPVATWPASAAPPAAPATKTVAAAARVDFARDVLPIFEAHCVECHGPKKTRGGLKLHAGEALLGGGITDRAVLPENSKGSYLMARLRGEGGEDRMPLERAPLGPDQITLIARWIDEGAIVPEEPERPYVPEISGLRRLTVAST